jgi:hypothetical protein
MEFESEKPTAAGNPAPVVPDITQIEPKRHVPLLDPGSGHVALAEDETAFFSEPDVATPIAERKRSRLSLVLIVLGSLLVLSAFAGLGTLAYLNDTRADDWQQRSEQLQRNATQLNELLVVRSGDLNERTADLNTTADSLRKARAALGRSESDVASLSRRQRELANEKAQVEDERGQLTVQASELESVAGAYVTCKAGLVDLVGAVARDDWGWVEYYYPTISADCRSAEDTLQSYLYSYGSE